MPRNSQVKIASIKRITLADSIISKAIRVISAAKHREFRIKIWNEFAAKEIAKDYAVIEDCKEALKTSTDTINRCWELNAQIEQALKLY